MLNLGGAGHVDRRCHSRWVIVGDVERRKGETCAIRKCVNRASTSQDPTNGSTQEDLVKNGLIVIGAAPS